MFPNCNETNTIGRSDALLSDVIKIEIYIKHRVRQDKFKGVTEGECLEALCKIEGMSSIFIHVAVLFDRYIVGAILRKIDMPGPKHATELHRAINFNIDFVRVLESLPPSVTQAVQMTEVSAVSAEGTIPTQVEVTEAGNLHIADHEVIKGLRQRVEEIELAPWQPLLKKVEKFNQLMVGISEVSLVKHFLLKH